MSKLIIDQHMINYQPTIPRINIYHRGGWKDVMDHIQQLHNQGVRVKFIDLIDNYYHNPRNPLINCHWVGIIHGVPGVPISDSPHLSQLLINKKFKRDLFYCLGIWTLSAYLKNYLKTQYIFATIPIQSLYHPTDLTVPQFEWNLFNNNISPKLIYIGNQDRCLIKFNQLHTKYQKVWLSGRDHNKSIEILMQQIKPIDSKILIDKVDDIEYDQLLTCNVIMMELYNSSTNNTILECIARNTPILVNKIGGVEEYLGSDYPLYFDNLLSIEKLINDPKKLKEGHDYLTKLDKSFLSFDRFIDDIVNDQIIAPKINKVNLNYLNKSKR